MLWVSIIEFRDSGFGCTSCCLRSCSDFSKLAKLPSLGLRLQVGFMGKIKGLGDQGAKVRGCDEVSVCVLCMATVRVWRFEFGVLPFEFRVLGLGVRV